jgi:hypothetical protein
VWPPPPAAAAGGAARRGGGGRGRAPQLGPRLLLLLRLRLAMVGMAPLAILAAGMIASLIVLGRQARRRKGRGEAATMSGGDPVLAVALLLDRLLSTAVKGYLGMGPSVASLTCVMCGLLVAVCGLLPQWDVAEARRHAAFLSTAIALMLVHFYRAWKTHGGSADSWSPLVLRRGQCIGVQGGQQPENIREDTPGAPDYCAVCNEAKPERVHHCSKCGRCCLRMDHHCDWVDNCVGLHNHKFFIGLCFWQLLASADFVYVYSASVRLAAHDAASVDWPCVDAVLTDNWLLCGGVLIVLAIADVVMAGLLLGFHLMLLGHDTTVLECIKEGWQGDQMAVVSGGERGRERRQHAAQRSTHGVDGGNLRGLIEWFVWHLRIMWHVSRSRQWRWGSFAGVLGNDILFWLLPSHPRLPQFKTC